MANTAGSDDRFDAPVEEESEKGQETGSGIALAKYIHFL